MEAYEIFHVQTQQIVDYLFVVVMIILPFFWFGNCRKAMSLLFKRIRLPALYDVSQEPIEISTKTQAAIVILGAIAYCMHRIWRKKLLNLKYSILKQENSYTDSKDFNDLISVLLRKVDNHIEKIKSEENSHNFDMPKEEISATKVPDDKEYLD